MPVYHRLQWAPEEQNADRPIDGVRPEDYPDAYQYLINLRCVTLAGGDVIQNTTDYYKMCLTCYESGSINREQEYHRIPPHNLIHKNSADNQTRCTICGKEIIIVRRASECRGCIEEYLYADPTLLDQGWGIPVVTRRAEE